MKTTATNTVLRKTLPRLQPPKSTNSTPGSSIKKKLSEIVKSHELQLAYSPIKGEEQTFNIKIVFPENSNMTMEQFNLLLEALEMLPLHIKQLMEQYNLIISIRDKVPKEKEEDSIELYGVKPVASMNYYYKEMRLYLEEFDLETITDRNYFKTTIWHEIGHAIESELHYESSFEKNKRIKEIYCLLKEKYEMGFKRYLKEHLYLDDSQIYDFKWHWEVAGRDDIPKPWTKERKQLLYLLSFDEAIAEAFAKCVFEDNKKSFGVPVFGFTLELDLYTRRLNNEYFSEFNEYYRKAVFENSELIDLLIDSKRKATKAKVDSIVKKTSEREIAFRKSSQQFPTTLAF